MGRTGDSHAGFSPGDTVLYRDIRAGRVMLAMPLRVIVDTPERTVLHLARDTSFKSARDINGEKALDYLNWHLTDLVWQGGSLIRLITPGSWHCVDVEFGPGGRFDGWYVNFQQPIRRTTHGFDSDDLILDLVVTPDRTWHIKDEEEFTQAVADGHIDADTEATVRAEAAEVIQRVKGWKPPFSEQNWSTWTPPHDWTTPALPSHWNNICRNDFS